MSTVRATLVRREKLFEVWDPLGSALQGPESAELRRSHRLLVGIVDELQETGSLSRTTWVFERVLARRGSRGEGAGLRRRPRARCSTRTQVESCPHAAIVAPGGRRRPASCQATRPSAVSRPLTFNCGGTTIAGMTAHGDAQRDPELSGPGGFSSARRGSRVSADPKEHFRSSGGCRTDRPYGCPYGMW